MSSLPHDGVQQRLGQHRSSPPVFSLSPSEFTANEPSSFHLRATLSLPRLPYPSIDHFYVAPWEGGTLGPAMPLRISSLVATVAALKEPLRGRPTLA